MNLKFLLSALLLAPLAALHAAEPARVDCNFKSENVMSHDDGQFLWFHRRVATIPG